MADEFIPPLDRPTVSVKMARQLLGDIGHDKVWRMIREGQLTVARIGRRTLVRTEIDQGDS
jgi:hypothetical protein